MTVLEASQLNGIPHASVCGGRGRCSTCRIRVSRGPDDCRRRRPQEQAVLARVGARAEYAPRLPDPADARSRRGAAAAADTATASRAMRKPRHAQGQRAGDRRSCSPICAASPDSREHKLPYDVVFVLNRYFAAMGAAVERAGGHVDKFIGDGVMALFGIDERCRDAAAARRWTAARSDGDACWTS